ncbi:uncharacterized protein LOC116617588 [Nematostella vectensis]|uniref:uncharacterized protein LOC116617588 n=1 Tax=Nematostella vectensis TaxID=45351 RepID=UPI00207704A6|nr:uncharacterized protein LOC116617588 [Nematostella vectensis]
MKREFLLFAATTLVCIGFGNAITCNHCLNNGTITECLKKGEVKKCAQDSQWCFYQESQPYHRNGKGKWTVSMGCGTPINNGCDERMGTLKCKHFCSYKENCNSDMARRPERLIPTAGSESVNERPLDMAVIVMLYIIVIHVGWDEFLRTLMKAATICF